MNQEEGQERQPENGPEAAEQASVWEWITAALGLVLVAGTLGFLVYSGLTAPATPPDITLRVESIVPTRDGFLVRFRATNQGGSTAEGVEAEAELRQGDETVETSQTTIDYVPAHSYRDGGFFFTKDPRNHNLQFRVQGYEEP